MDSINFFDIKNDIISYLQRQDSIKDLNYEASAINALIDALAYAAYHINVYANFALNESFLKHRVCSLPIYQLKSFCHAYIYRHTGS